MRVVQAGPKKISGLSIRTLNNDEMNSTTAKIGPLWEKFDSAVTVDYKNGARMYGLYFGYESDANGEFTVLAGTDQVSPPSTAVLEEITIPAGKYLVFEAKGEMPQIVIDAWGDIWNCFSSGDAEYERAYNVDFEYYNNENEIEIYISVK
ncbi:GyrI-like domain-containing protein [Pseudomonadota bacterium]